jgi:hypothetical protein
MLVAWVKKMSGMLMRCRLIYTYTHKRADQCLLCVPGSPPTPGSKGNEIKHGLLIKAAGALKKIEERTVYMLVTYM